MGVGPAHHTHSPRANWPRPGSRPPVTGSCRARSALPRRRRSSAALGSSEPAIQRFRAVTVGRGQEPGAASASAISSADARICPRRSAFWVPPVSRSGRLDLGAHAAARQLGFGQAALPRSRGDALDHRQWLYGRAAGRRRTSRRCREHHLRDEAMAARPNRAVRGGMRTDRGGPRSRPPAAPNADRSGKIEHPLKAIADGGRCTWFLTPATRHRAKAAGRGLAGAKAR